MTVTLLGAKQTDNDLVNSFSVSGGIGFPLKWLLRRNQLLKISKGLRFSDSIIGVGKLLVEARRRLELGSISFRLITI